MKAFKFKILAGLFFFTVGGFMSTASAQNVGGCKDTDFVDGAELNQIGTSGLTYTPRCLRVKVGSRVTISASSHHPLSAMPDIDLAPNPFAGLVGAVSAQTRIMNEPGFFGYFCEAHGDAEGDGMAGIIQVVL